MATRQPLQSIGLQTNPDGSTQRPLMPMSPRRGTVTNTDAINLETVQETYTAPDLADAAVFTWKRDPTYNAILVPVVGHASAPVDLWAYAALFGVREWADGSLVKYIRQYLGTIGFQGAASKFTLTAATEWPGFTPRSAPTVDEWAWCDVSLVVEDAMPSPGIRVLHESTSGAPAIGFAVDTHGCAWIEAYPVCAVPSGAAGSAATECKFFITEM